MAVQQYTVGIESEPVAAEDVLRAQLYRLLASWLSDAPDQDLLDRTARLTGDQSPLGKAIGTLAHLSARTPLSTAAVEYHDLLIGVGRGELVPFGSYYLTGFLQEKPLAKLRHDMRRLHIVRADDVSEPEDHIASILEMMAGLIDGTFARALTIAQQKSFFEQHLSSWAGHFFKDLGLAKSAILYAGVAAVGTAFLELETGAFALE